MEKGAGNKKERTVKRKSERKPNLGDGLTVHPAHGGKKNRGEER